MNNQNPARRTQKAIAQDLLKKIISAAEEDRIATVAACDGALEILTPKAPEAAPLFGLSRDDAWWWAEFASDTMRVAMLEACLRHTATRKINTIRARRRALIAIWNTLDERERSAFLDSVDPGPGAKG